MTEKEIQEMAAEFTHDYGEAISDALRATMEPGDMYAVFYFRNLQVDGEPGVLSAMRSNIASRPEIMEAVLSVLQGFRDAEIIDLRDVQGRMQ